MAITGSSTDDMVDLQRQNEELAKELWQTKGALREALEHQAATSEILRVISSSPTDMQRVFTTLAYSAVRLCDAHDAAIFQAEGDTLRFVAHEGPIRAMGPVGKPPCPWCVGPSWDARCLTAKQSKFPICRSKATSIRRAVNLPADLGTAPYWPCH